MIVIPLVLGESEMDIAIVLEDDNLQRMKEHDPAEVVRSQMSIWKDHAIRNVIVCYASPEDMVEVTRAMREGEAIGDTLRFLSRGFRYRPDLGDQDGEPYVVQGGEEVEEMPVPARQHRPRVARKQ